MLPQRIGTAVVLLAVLIGALAWSVTAFAAVVTLVIIIAIVEWLQLLGWRRGPALVLSLALGVTLFLIDFRARGLAESLVLPLSAIATALWVLIAVVLLRPGQSQVPEPSPVLAMIVGIVLAVSAWFALVHFLHRSPVFLLSVLVIVWVADTAAYFAGRSFGKRKLAPKISPGKTWAGVYGAMLAVVAVAYAVWAAWPAAPFFSNELFAKVGVPLTLILLALLVALSIIGDLFESLLKRRAGVKDSSQLLPGHGGMFDRIDALVPLLPAAALFEQLVR
jgi:phosphatidate cytidylyltransferase